MHNVYAYWAIFLSLDCRFHFTLVVIHLESFAEPFRTSYYSSLTICVYYKHTARFHTMLFHFHISYATPGWLFNELLLSLVSTTVNETRYERIWWKMGKYYHHHFTLGCETLLFSLTGSGSRWKMHSNFKIFISASHARRCEEGYFRLMLKFDIFNLKFYHSRSHYCVWGDGKGIVAWFHYRCCHIFVMKWKTDFGESEHFNVSREKQF